MKRRAEYSDQLRQLESFQAIAQQYDVAAGPLTADELIAEFNDYELSVIFHDIAPFVQRVVRAIEEHYGQPPRPEIDEPDDE